MVRTSALSVFVILWGVAVLYSFLAAMGFACAWRGRSYIVASSSGKTSGFDPLMDGSTPSATAIIYAIE